MVGMETVVRRGGLIGQGVFMLAARGRVITKAILG